MSDAEKANFAYIVGNNLVSVFITAVPEHGQNPLVATGGVQSVLYSMVLNSYAAFETLAGDLWIESVNGNQKLQAEFAHQNKDKTIPLSRMAQFGNDLSNVMGRVLVEDNKARFQSLGDIKRSYSAAFGQEIEAAFSVDDNLVACEKVRHLIAHRSGLVDRKFADELSEISLLTNQEVGEYLTLNGDIVCSLVNGVVRTSVAIIKFVDNWIALNSGKMS